MQLRKTKISNSTIFSILGILIIILSLYFNDSHNVYSYIITYIGIFAVILQIPDNKYTLPVKVVFLLPALILGLIGPLLKICFFMLFAYFLPAGIIALFFKVVPVWLFNIDLSYTSNLYLALTFSLIFITIFSEKLIIMINKIMNIEHGDELVENYSNLTLHLINRARTKYLIYFLFFCYIIIYTVYNLNDIELFEIKNTNVAIMQTFGTYLAFDRLISNKNLLILEPKLFISKIYKIWKFDFQKR